MKSRYPHHWFILTAMVALVVSSATPAMAQCPCVTQASGFAGGDGSPGDPYQVCMPEHLNNVRNHLGSNFIQTADIDMAGYAMIPIGSHADGFFGGVYNGGGFTISNVTINLPGQEDVGLFGVIDNGASVGNFTAENFVIIGGGYVGAIAGYSFGTVFSVLADVDVSGGSGAGGLVGSNSGLVSMCRTIGSVSATHTAGGLIGVTHNHTAVEKCYSNAVVSATWGTCGGLIATAGFSTVLNSYSNGAVDCSGEAGGLLGLTTSAVFLDSFWDTQTSGQATSDGGTGLTTAQMQLQTSFDPPWDFTNVWTIDEGNDYPRLRIESTGCQSDCACADGDLCNGIETCNAGTCTSGTPADCSSFDDECSIGTCNPANGQCEQDVATPAGNVCRVASSDCDAGESCDGINPTCPADECSEAGTSCNDGSTHGTCDGNCGCAGAPIPTVSEWGLAVMMLLMLALGTVVIMRGRHRPTS